jgi:hypothetical protein
LQDARCNTTFIVFHCSQQKHLQDHLCHFNGVLKRQMAIKEIWKIVLKNWTFLLNVPHIYIKWASRSCTSQSHPHHNHLPVPTFAHIQTNLLGSHHSIWDKRWS